MADTNIDTNEEATIVEYDSVTLGDGASITMEEATERLSILQGAGRILADAARVSLSALGEHLRSVREDGIAAALILTDEEDEGLEDRRKSGFALYYRSLGLDKRRVSDAITAHEMRTMAEGTDGVDSDVLGDSVLINMSTVLPSKLAQVVRAATTDEGNVTDASSRTAVRETSANNLRSEAKNARKRRDAKAETKSAAPKSAASFTDALSVILAADIADVLADEATSVEDVENAAAILSGFAQGMRTALFGDDENTTTN